MGKIMQAGCAKNAGDIRKPREGISSTAQCEITTTDHAIETLMAMTV